MHCAWTSRHIFGRILFLRTKTAILSVCSSIHTFVTWVDQSKMVQARITKSSPSLHLEDTGFRNRKAFPIP